MNDKNENCLAGMRCPECKSDGPFWIEGTAMFKLFDDGTDDYEQVELKDDGACKCCDCGHFGTVGDFRVANGEESNG